MRAQAPIRPLDAMKKCHFEIGRIGAGVTDLLHARNFYAALGFTTSEDFELGTTVSPQSEVPGSNVRIHIVNRGGFHLELVQPSFPRLPARPPVRRPLNQLGLSHLALAVDDVDRARAVIERSGGYALAFTRSRALGVDALFCTDPFGIRILLLGPGTSALGSTPLDADGIAIAHVGISVADLAESTRFYRGLGFEIGRPVDCGPRSATWPSSTTCPSRSSRSGRAPIRSCSSSGAQREMPAWRSGFRSSEPVI